MKDENGNILAQYTHTQGGKLKEIRHGNGMHTWYCWNNPVIYFDPSGFSVLDDIIKNYNDNVGTAQSANSNNPWINFKHVVGYNDYKADDIVAAYHKMQCPDGDGHYIQRCYVRNSTHSRMGDDVTFGSLRREVGEAISKVC